MNIKGFEISLEGPQNILATDKLRKPCFLPISRACGLCPPTFVDMAFKLFGLHFLRRWKRKQPAQTQRKQPLNKWKPLQLESGKTKLRRDLQEATAIIDAQKKQLAEYDFLLTHSQAIEIDSAVNSFRPDMKEITMPVTPLSPKSTPTSRWIEDIWLCVDHDIKCLKHAERHWKNGNPAYALQHVSNSINAGSHAYNPFISPCEEMRCRVFIAAVLHTLGKYEDSKERVDVTLQMIANGYIDQANLGRVFPRPSPRDTVGITHYIQGRNLMKLGSLPEAYLSFSRALEVPHYHDTVRGFQQQVIVDITSCEAAADADTDTASLRPLYS